MKGIIYISLLLLGVTFEVMAQGNLDVYRGNESFKEGDYEQAEKHYSNALEKAPESFKGVYNMGNTSYRQEKFEDALTQYEQAIANSNNDQQRSEAYHNLGNTYLQSGKLKESIDAYKQALRLTPSAQDTRYNLAYAQKLLKEQQKQEQENKDKNEDEQEKQEQQDKENQENQDKSEKDKDSEGDQNDKGEEDKKKDEEPKKNKPSDDKSDEGDEKEQQPQPVNISPREAEQMLEAAKEEDQRIQMMLLNKEKKGESKKIEKNW